MSEPKLVLEGRLRVLLDTASEFVVYVGETEDSDLRATLFDCSLFPYTRKYPEYHFDGVYRITVEKLDDSDSKSIVRSVSSAIRRLKSRVKMLGYDWKDVKMPPVAVPPSWPDREES